MKSTIDDITDLFFIVYSCWLFEHVERLRRRALFAISLSTNGMNYLSIRIS